MPKRKEHRNDFSKKDYFDYLLTLTPSSVYWKDLNGVYLGCNLSMLEMVGLSSIREIIGKTDYDLPWKESAGMLQEHDQEVIKSGKLQSFEETGKLSNGSTITVICNKMPLVNKAGEIIGSIGSSIDITRLKRTEIDLKNAKEAAEAASHAKTEFLENMRHDIRTPLSGIIGCARVIQSQPNNSEKVSEYADDLVQSSESLLNFLNRILEGIKVATGETPLLKKKFDFKKTIQAIIDLNKSLAAKKNLTLTLDVDAKIPPYLIGDPIRLQRIILELVTNALRFTQEGTIDVEAKLKKHETQQDVIEIKVRDTGIGISKDKQEEIFTQFTRLTPAYQGTYKGLGLGLSIVKQLVDDLGGEIYVESQLNQGTTFTCFIPFQNPLVMDEVGIENIPTHDERKSYTSTSGILTFPNRAAYQSINIDQRKILLVEDDKLAAKIVESILTELNCMIDIAPDAKTALKLIQEQDYQLILMDIGLPDIDGIALTHRIRLQQWQRTDTTPIIGLTAHIDVENRQRCLDAGMNTVILKPLKKETAKELLKTFVPEVNVNQASSAGMYPITGAVLDIDAMKVLLKNEELIKDCIHLMLIELKKNLVEIPRLHQSANWQAIREIAHKMQGGACYCGAKRLEQACQQIDDYIRENGPTGQTNEFYRQLIKEIETAREVFEDYIKK